MFTELWKIINDDIAIIQCMKEDSLNRVARIYKQKITNNQLQPFQF